MEFKQLQKKVKDQFNNMQKNGILFRSEVSGDKIWEIYLNSFEKKNVFRDPDSDEHNCNLCKRFFHRYGNIVSIDKNGDLESMFSNINGVEQYQAPIDAIDKALKNSPVKDVFFETFDELNSLNYEKCKRTQEVYKLGIERNLKKYTKEEVEKFGVVKEDIVYEFNHFSVFLDKKFVDFSGKSVESVIAKFKDKYSVFKRFMDETPLDTFILVRDLILQGSLLDGDAHLHVIDDYIELKTAFDVFINENKDNWYWKTSYTLNERVAKARSTVVGTLCVELSEGKELNKACEDWNKRVDPINYHKAKAPITKKQIEDAKKFVTENGYEESFDRRLATIDDIKVDEILHINSGDGNVKKLSIFDDLKPSGEGRFKRDKFDNVEEVGIEKFMKDILPTCTSLEVLLENKMENNMVVVTKASSDSSRPIFKWDNNYSWTFNGNIAGKSQIKDAVKSRGGKTDADLRISLFFPETTDDYDLHVIDSNGNHINYHNLREEHFSSGILDLDAQGVDGHQPPEKRIENVVFSDKSKMKEGKIKVWVVNYSGRGFNSPFDIEIETGNGDITLLKYNTKTTKNEVTVGEIEFHEGEFTLFFDKKMTLIDSKTMSKNIWGLETNNFHKVNLVCLSPNHWGGNKVGNLHYMFMLDNCRCDVPIRGFHNENLIPELLKHRKVMEVLGNTNMIEPNGKQLAGIGFNSTVRDELVVRCKGSFNRMIKIKF